MNLTGYALRVAQSAIAAYFTAFCREEIPRALEAVKQGLAKIKCYDCLRSSSPTPSTLV